MKHFIIITVSLSPMQLSLRHKLQMTLILFLSDCRSFFFFLFLLSPPLSHNFLSFFSLSSPVSAPHSPLSIISSSLLGSDITAGCLVTTGLCGLIPSSASPVTLSLSKTLKPKNRHKLSLCVWLGIVL